MWVFARSSDGLYGWMGERSAYIAGCFANVYSMLTRLCIDGVLLVFSFSCCLHTMITPLKGL